MYDSLKAQALQALVGLRNSIPLDVVARWSHGEAKVGDLHVDADEFRALVRASGSPGPAGYPVESRFVMDEILSRVGILCRTGLPPRHQLYLRPKPTHLRLQDIQGRHRTIAEAWLADHAGLCLHVGGGPHIPVDGPAAVPFLRALHDAATARTDAVELWQGITLDAGQARALCQFLESLGVTIR